MPDAITPLDVIRKYGYSDDEYQQEWVADQVARAVKGDQISPNEIDYRTIMLLRSIRYHCVDKYVPRTGFGQAALKMGMIKYLDTPRTIVRYLSGGWPLGSFESRFDITEIGIRVLDEIDSK